MWRSSAYVRNVLIGALMPVPNSPDGLYRFADRNLGITQIPDEVQAFHAFLRGRSPRVVLEVGTYSGGHLCMLSRALPTVTTLIGVDLLVRNKALLRRLAPRGVNLHLIDGDSHSPSTRQAIERALGRQPIDVLFIDGDHTYDGVRGDYEMYRDLVREGGVIGFHDIVEERRNGKQGHWVGGVPLFWREVKANAQTQEFVSDPKQDGYGIGVMMHPR